MNGNELITKEEVEFLRNLSKKIQTFRTNDSVKDVQDLNYHLYITYQTAKDIHQNFPNGIY